MLGAERDVQAQAAQGRDCHSRRGTAAITGLKLLLSRLPPGLWPASWLRTAPAAPPHPAPPCHPASPPQPGPRALVPALRGDDQAIPLPKPSASADSQTCSVAAAAAAAAAILTRCSPRLRSGTGVGLTPSVATPCRAPATPPREIQCGSVRSSGQAQIRGGGSLATVSGEGWTGVAGIVRTLGRPQIPWKGRSQSPKHVFPFHTLSIMECCTIPSCDDLRGREVSVRVLVGEVWVQTKGTDSGKTVVKYGTLSLRH